MKNPRYILITGASSGIGEALALQYARDGRVLFLSGRDEGRLAAVAAACRERGAGVETAPVDVRDKGAMAAFIRGADDRYPLDLVIANAGISGGTDGGPMRGEAPDQVRQIFDVNLNGVLNTVEPIVPRMLERGCGQVAVISSLAAFRGWPGAPAYSASKGAVRFYGEALRGALHGTGVQVNVICPGFVVSRMTAVNKFPMPFLMTAERAAAIIENNLAKNRGRIAFPLPTYLIAWGISVLPDYLIQGLLRHLPAKSRR